MQTVNTDIVQKLDACIELLRERVKVMTPASENTLEVAKITGSEKFIGGATKLAESTDATVKVMLNTLEVCETYSQQLKKLTANL